MPLKSNKNQTEKRLDISCALFFNFFLLLLANRDEEDIVYFCCIISSSEDQIRSQKPALKNSNKIGSI